MTICDKCGEKEGFLVKILVQPDRRGDEQWRSTIFAADLCDSCRKVAHESVRSFSNTRMLTAGTFGRLILGHHHLERW